LQHNGNIPIYNSVALVTLVISLLIWKKSETDSKLQRDINIVTAMMTIGYFVYTLSLICVYLISDGLQGGGGYGINSFDRYLSSYLTGMLVVVIAAVCKYVSDVKRRNNVIRRTVLFITSVVIFALIPANILLYLTPARFNYEDYGFHSAWVVNSAAYTSRLNKDTDKLYIIYANGDEQRFLRSHYNLIPIRTNSIYGYGEPKLSIRPQKVYDADLDWANDLISSNFTHILLQNVDDDFRWKFWLMFDCSPLQIAEGQLYKVVKTGDSDMPVRFEQVDVPIYSY
jgi:hypothetical protein